MGKSRNKKINAKAEACSTAGAISPERWKTVIIPLAIVIFTCIMFYPAINDQLKNWDDMDYIIQNLLIRDLSPAGIVKIFTTPVLGMYNPIPFLIYAVDYNLWGLDPRPYNITNIILHLLAIVAIYRFIYRLSGKYETATIVALLFAIHPMHVEAVCWASETKTPLFILFYITALSQYLKYLKDDYKPKYLFYITGLFILSALSKPEAVTLPPMLLLIDYYKGRKINLRLFTEKAPFFALALFFGILTLYTHIQQGDTIFKVTRNYSLINNLLVSNYSIVFYIEKLLLPFGLSAIYPYPSNSILPVQYYLAIPVIPVLCWLIYKSGKFRKELIFGVVFFTIAISVLLRIAPSGFFETANRYSYLSYTGLFFIIGQFYVYLKENRFDYATGIKKYVTVALGLYLALCCWRSAVRVDVWQNSVTLFTDVINKQPGLAMAWDMRSVAKSKTGDFGGAIADENRAVELDTNYAQAYNNRASYKFSVKDYDGAMKDCNKALSIDPKWLQAYLNRGCIEATQGHMQEALADMNTCIQLDPGQSMAYYNRASVKMALHDTAGALVDRQKAQGLGFEAPQQKVLAKR